MVKDGQIQIVSTSIFGTKVIAAAATHWSFMVYVTYDNQNWICNHGESSKAKYECGLLASLFSTQYWNEGKYPCFPDAVSVYHAKQEPKHALQLKWYRNRLLFDSIFCGCDQLWLPPNHHASFKHLSITLVQSLCESASNKLQQIQTQQILFPCYVLIDRKKSPKDSLWENTVKIIKTINPIFLLLISYNQFK